MLLQLFANNKSQRLLTTLILISLPSLHANSQSNNDLIISHTINLDKQKLVFYSKNDQGQYFKNIEGLRTKLDSLNHKLIFAMNGGMFNTDLSPTGLYIENGKLITPIDNAKEGYGNFHMKPNGVFYIAESKKAVISKTEDFVLNANISFATQSGPMLIIDGKIHPKFTEGSKNLNIRNGVGILENGEIVFAISKREINFYDFASYFKDLGCKNALYLDGFVSQIYLPAKNVKQVDGKYGIIIAELEK